VLKLLVRKKINKAKVKRVIIRATNWVGDAVMTLPALEAVKENFPSASITVLAKPWVEPIFSNHPAVDRILAFKKGEGAFTGLGEMIRAIRLIRKGRFDLAILFQNAFEAALLLYMGGVKYRIGYSTDGRGFLLTHKIMPSDEVLKIHQSEYYLSILRGMGWEAKSRNPTIHVSQEDKDLADRILGTEGIKERDPLGGPEPWRNRSGGPNGGPRIVLQRSETGQLKSGGPRSSYLGAVRRRRFAAMFAVQWVTSP